MLKRLLALLTIGLSLSANAGTITGVLQGPSGIPIKNATLSFNLNQAGLAIGTGAIVPITAQCFTSNDGSVVGMPNPLQVGTTAASYGSGTLPAGTYYVEYTFYGNNYETLASPEFTVLLTGTGQFQLSAPSGGLPANVTGIKVYVGLTSGTEVAQGQTVGTAPYVQNTPVALGAGGPPSTNDSVCSIIFNDAIIPYTGYTLSLTSSTGNAYPGYPQSIQLNGGLNGTINVSAGAPQWNGVVIYPAPVLMQPLNHGPQSIAGLLNMTGYNLVNVGNLGAGGNALPSYPIDATGLINTSQGFTINGAAPLHHFLCGDGTEYADSPSPCTTTGGQPYYFIDFSNSFPLTQRGGNNFLPPLVATDNAPGNTTNITLQPSGVTAGSYTAPNITVDTYGRVTSAANSTLPQYTIQTLHINAGGCTTSSGSESYCTISPQSWPVAFPSSSYNTVCSYSGLPTGTGTYPGMYGPYVVGQTNSTVTVSAQSGSNAAGGTNTTPLITCIGFYPR